MYKYICECNIEHENFLYWYFECKCKYCMSYYSNNKLIYSAYKAYNLCFIIDYINKCIFAQDPNNCWIELLKIPFVEFSSNEEYITYFEKYMENLIFL